MTNFDSNEDFGMNGDARRCPRHPSVPTSSADGMFDAPCGVCEAEMEEPVETPTITLHDALKAVSDHCDHARNRDDVGFSGLDANFANKMAALDRLSPAQEWYVAKFVRKYRRQVVENFEARGMQITQGLKGKAKVAAVDAFLGRLVWQYQDINVILKSMEPKRTIKAMTGQDTGELRGFVVRFPYKYEAVEGFKNSFDYRDRSFDKSNNDPRWVLKPVTSVVVGIDTLVREFGFVLSDGAKAALETLRQKVAA